MPLHLFFSTACSSETYFDLRHLDWAKIVSRSKSWLTLSKDELAKRRKLPWFLYGSEDAHGLAYGVWGSAVAGAEGMYGKKPEHYSLITFLRYQKPVIEISMMLTSGYCREGYSLIPPRWFDPNPAPPLPAPPFATAYHHLLGEE